MPLEEKYRPTKEADWSFKVVDMDRRLVAFKDESIGQFTSWHWDFGDGSSSTDQNPQHAYARPGHYTVILDVDGPSGKARRSKVWDVAVK
jgi:PKD repeat protein